MSEAQQRKAIDWNDDEAVVRAAFKEAEGYKDKLLYYECHGRPCEAELYVAMWDARMTRHTNIGASWARVRNIQPVVQQFERLHNPKYAQIAAQPSEAARLTREHAEHQKGRAFRSLPAALARQAVGGGDELREAAKELLDCVIAEKATYFARLRLSAALSATPKAAQPEVKHG